MNYSEPLISQITVFFRSLGCGILLGILYDATCIIRMIFGERKSVYVFFDTLFFLAASLISFFFMIIYNSGQIRLNLMIAEFFGAVAFHLSLGKYILGKYACQLSRIRKVFVFLTKPFRKVSKIIRPFLLNLRPDILKIEAERENTAKKFKKFCNIIKFPLKNKNKSV
ncbi:MAG: spore cortex biosynthesis protein YabQ [Clostridia bacterium]|nr:spore cortex biosynthesis protein YabQ [Clostridia bacterium]